MTISESDRLANEPVLISFNDGRKVPLKFGYGALRRIEKEYGSLSKFSKQMEDPEESAVFDAIFFALQAGLWKLGLSEEQLDDLVDPVDFQDQAPAVMEALQKAFPRKVQEDAKKTSAAGRAQKSSSPGPITTTPQPSASDAQMVSSGI